MIIQMKKVSQLFQKLMKMLYLIPPSKEIVKQNLWNIGYFSYQRAEFKATLFCDKLITNSYLDY